MKKINFLINLNNEKKLDITEPSENIKESYIQKSNNSLKSAIILLENSQIEDSVSMAYYSMYNMLTALLYKTGIKCENHSAAIIILQELFKLDNSKISFAKKERIDKQYYVDFKATKEDAEAMIESAKEFNSMLYDFIEKLTSKQIDEYRSEIRNILHLDC